MGRRNYRGYDYYPRYTPATPIEVEDGIKLKQQRGKISKNWWSKRWINYLESFRMGARLNRGKAYARKGQVISIDTEHGEVNAQVQGSSRVPYHVSIKLTPLSLKDWEDVIEKMMESAKYSSMLLCGEMPTDIESVFMDAKHPLFPSKRNDLHTECSCPDYANPCKHIAAVYFILAEKFDENPFLLFELRGKSKKSLLAEIQKKRSNFSISQAQNCSANDQNTSEPANNDNAFIGYDNLDLIKDGVAHFWHGGVDELSLTYNMQPPALNLGVLTRMGKPSGLAGGGRLMTLMGKIYNALQASSLLNLVDEEKVKRKTVDANGEILYLDDSIIIKKAPKKTSKKKTPKKSSKKKTSKKSAKKKTSKRSTKKKTPKKTSKNKIPKN
jgi:uncharacterized Zn finger protein